MKQFRLIDNALGWLAFFIAAFVYCSRGTILHAYRKPVLAVYKRPDTGGKDGEHHECTAIGNLYTVPVLDHHSSYTQTANKQLG